MTSDWSAAYTPNAGPDGRRGQDPALRRTQEVGAGVRRPSSGEGSPRDTAFSDLEFAFDAGGMVRSAMNEGKSTPISIRVTGKDQKTAHRIASAHPRRGRARSTAWWTPGSSSGWIIPQYVIKVDRAKSAQLGLTQADVMKAVIAALNSSIQFNKHNFWIDPKSKNQYYVGVSYFEKDIESIDTCSTSPSPARVQNKPVPMRNVVTVDRTPVPTEVTHYNIQPTIELTMGVEGRDLGHVSDDVAKVLERVRRAGDQGAVWEAYDPDSTGARRRCRHQDRALRRVPPDDRHLRQPGGRPAAWRRS